MCLVYQHRRKDNNEVFYVGIGKSEKRAYSKDKRNKYWHNIVDKYGYSVEIIYDNLSVEDAKEVEKFLILLYGRKDLKLGSLCNMTDGGDGTINRLITEETRTKLSLKIKGRKLSLKHRHNLSVSHKGKIISEEQRFKISETLKGRKLSDKTKSKLRIKGFCSDNIEHLKRVSENNCKEVIQMDMNYNIIAYFNSLKEASKVTGVSSQAIGKVCKGLRNKAGNFKWKYKNET